MKKARYREIIQNLQSQRDDLSNQLDVANQKLESYRKAMESIAHKLKFANKNNENIPRVSKVTVLHWGASGRYCDYCTTISPEAVAHSNWEVVFTIPGDKDEVIRTCDDHLTGRNHLQKAIKMRIERKNSKYPDFQKSEG